MDLPTYDQFIEPVLRFLARQSDEVRAAAAHDAAADALGLSEGQRAALVPSGQQLVYKNRAGWAHDRLKRAGLSQSVRRGHWQLTDKGREFAASHPEPLSTDQVDELAKGYMDVLLVPRDDGDDTLSAGIPTPPAASQPPPKASPDEQLDQALGEIRASVTADLLALMATCTPLFFEQLVLDVLHAMGYGASRRDVQRTGATGDEGIDGIISLDRLGLERVYVQAKRWSNSVGRPEIQGFYGALAGRRATKGVFLTTSQFTSGAREFAESVGQIVLVDGAQLAGFMIDHGVGVSHTIIKRPALDSDYFEE